jgi:uncharacterized protein (DUF934 family)
VDTRPLTSDRAPVPGHIAEPHARGTVGAEPEAKAPPAPETSARVSDARDPAGAIWRDGAFRGDAWVSAVDGEPLPDSPVIVRKKRWLAERAALGGRNAALGLHLDAGEGIDDIAADLRHFSLIALAFPKFSDGRAFSTARLLREKYEYAGELRAVGNVLSDQIPLMRRVGFDAFEATHAPTRSALSEGRLAEVTLHYQPAGAGEPPAGTRPWLRRNAG